MARRPTQHPSPEDAKRWDELREARKALGRLKRLLADEKEKISSGRTR